MVDSRQYLLLTFNQLLLKKSPLNKQEIKYNNQTPITFRLGYSTSFTCYSCLYSSFNIWQSVISSSIDCQHHVHLPSTEPWPSSSLNSLIIDCLRTHPTSRFQIRVSMYLMEDKILNGFPIKYDNSNGVDYIRALKLYTRHVINIRVQAGM